MLYGLISLIIYIFILVKNSEECKAKAVVGMKYINLKSV